MRYGADADDVLPLIAASARARTRRHQVVLRSFFAMVSSMMAATRAFVKVLLFLALSHGLSLKVNADGCACVRACARVCLCVCVPTHAVVCGGAGLHVWLRVLLRV